MILGSVYWSWNDSDMSDMTSDDVARLEEKTQCPRRRGRGRRPCSRVVGVDIVTSY